MSKQGNGSFTAKQAAQKVSVSIGTFRLWAWKLDVKPDYRTTEYPTRKGRRVGALAIYTAEQVAAIKAAWAKRRDSSPS